MSQIYKNIIEDDIVVWNGIILRYKILKRLNPTKYRYAKFSEKTEYLIKQK